MKVPFGIAQIGKAFRNEIVARQFIFRMREFEQMEMHSLYAPVRNWNGLKNGKRPVCVGISSWDSGKKTIVFMITRKLAHYANAATDIEFKFPFGFKEVEGIHSRTDFDLSQHQQYSGKKIHISIPN